MSSSRILLIDDDPAICRMIRKMLELEGYEVSVAQNGLDGQAFLAENKYDLVILDLMLPDVDGLSLGKQISHMGGTGLIIISGKSEIVDRIVGLEVGADDYVSKPFDRRELLARTRSVIRRTGSNAHEADGSGEIKPHEIVIFAGWEINLGSRELFSPEGRLTPLTSAEFSILEALVSQANRVISRDELLGLVAGRDWEPSDRSIDVLIAKVRRKLGESGRGARVIKTVRNFGYILSVPIARRSEGT
jgi:two-component system, OmpR family, response regulator